MFKQVAATKLPSEEVDPSLGRNKGGCSFGTEVELPKDGCVACFFTQNPPSLFSPMHYCILFKWVLDIFLKNVIMEGIKL